MPVTAAELLSTQRAEQTQRIVDALRSIGVTTIVIATSSRTKGLFVHLEHNGNSIAGLEPVLGDFDQLDATLTLLATLADPSTGEIVVGRSLVAGLIPMIHWLIHNGDLAFLHDTDIPVGSLGGLPIVLRSTLGERDSHDPASEAHNKAGDVLKQPGEVVIAMDTVGHVINPGPLLKALTSYLDAFRDSGGKIGKPEKTYRSVIEAVAILLSYSRVEVEAIFEAYPDLGELCRVLFRFDTIDLLINQMWQKADQTQLITALQQRMTRDEFFTALQAVIFENDRTHIQHQVGVSAKALFADGEVVEAARTAELIGRFDPSVVGSLQVIEGVGLGGLFQQVLRESDSVLDHLSSPDMTSILPPAVMQSLEGSEGYGPEMTDMLRQLAWLKMLSHIIGYPSELVFKTLEQLADTIEAHLRQQALPVQQQAAVDSGVVR